MRKNLEHLRNEKETTNDKTRYNDLTKRRNY